MQVQEQGQGPQRFQTSEMRKRSASNYYIEKKKPKKEENPITDSLQEDHCKDPIYIFSGLLGRRLECPNPVNKNPLLLT